MVLDHLADRLVDVALLLVELLLGRHRGAVERTDAADGAVQRLVHEAGGDVGGDLGDLGRQRPADALGEAHAQPTKHRWTARHDSSEARLCDDVPVPVEPPPTPWAFPPADSGDGDLVAIGADLAPGHRARGLPAGAVPDGGGRPGSRAVARRWPGGRPRSAACCRSPSLRVTRSMRQSARRFEIRVDTAFDEVVAGCADPSPVRRLDRRRRSSAAYTELHRLGWAHSVEAWRDGELAGGLYGVAIGGLFAGRVDVHPRARRLEGRADGPGRPAQRRARRRSGCSTRSGRPRTSRRSGSWRSRGRTTCGGSSDALPLPLPAAFARLSRSDDERVALGVAHHRPARRRPSRSSRRRG